MKVSNNSLSCFHISDKYPVDLLLYVQICLKSSWSGKQIPESINWNKVD